MRWNRFLPFALTLAGLCLLTGALRGPLLQSSGAEPALPGGLSRLAEAPVAVPDGAATASFERALARLSDPDRPWLRTAVWLRCRVPDLCYQAEGVYWRAPGGRFRLELRTEAEGGRKARPVRGVLQTVCDGRQLWQAQQVGDGEREVKHSELVSTSLKPADELALRRAALENQGLHGVEQLMRSLQAHLSWVRREAAGTGREVLTGAWRAELRSLLLPAGQRWPAALPRLCRLTLQGDWPARLEWWGPAEEGGPDRLLVEMEHREPAFDQPLSEEECRRLFHTAP